VVGLSDSIGLGETVGVVTDRDIVLRVIAAEKDPNLTKVEEIMTSDIVCCREDTAIEQALAIMAEKQVRCLVVLNEADLVTGTVSLKDVTVEKEGDMEMVGEVLDKSLSF
jgi:CBS domain-containing protein